MPDKICHKVRALHFPALVRQRGSNNHPLRKFANPDWSLNQPDFVQELDYVEIALIVRQSFVSYWIGRALPSFGVAPNAVLWTPKSIHPSPWLPSAT